LKISGAIQCWSAHEGAHELGREIVLFEGAGESEVSNFGGEIEAVWLDFAVNEETDEET
jgi:hypothetical protein